MVTTCAVIVYSPVGMILWCLCSKVRVEREYERLEIRWKLWLSEKAILLWVRLMEEMIKTREIVGTVRSEL